MSKYHTWGVYAKYEGRVTHDMLNKAYSDAGMFFKTYPEAQVHQMQAGGKIYPIRNYHLSDLDGKHVRPGAKHYIEGYYVSHPPELKPQGKVYQFKTQRRTP